MTEKQWLENVRGLKLTNISAGIKSIRSHIGMH